VARAGKCNEQIRDLWMACYTQEEIAKAVNVGQPTVNGFINSVSGNQNDKTSDNDDDGSEEEIGPAKFRKIAASPAAQHQTEFDLPIYNVWKQQTKSEGSSHFGNSEVRWVDNLLYDVRCAAHRKLLLSAIPMMRHCRCPLCSTETGRR
jgi:hypothetical protein